MKKNELIEFLQRQNEYLQGRLDEALASVNSLTLANDIKNFKKFENNEAGKALVAAGPKL